MTGLLATLKIRRTVHFIHGLLRTLEIGPHSVRSACYSSLEPKITSKLPFKPILSLLCNSRLIDNIDTIQITKFSEFYDLLERIMKADGDSTEKVMVEIEDVQISVITNRSISHAHRRMVSLVDYQDYEGLTRRRTR